MAKAKTCKRRRLTQALTSSKGHDLNVLLPEISKIASSTKGPTTKLQNRKVAILDRLLQLGYGTIALSHTVYGRLRPERDAAETVITFPENDAHGCSLLRRVNVVIEELSDVGFYSGAKTGESQGTGQAKDTNRSILSGYDIVAISPRNDAAFSAVCSSARAVDLIMLDYHSARVGRLPYRLRASDIRAATELGIAFELCYGPAIADPAKRKFFVQAAGEFITASIGVRPKPTLILSSGPRTTASGDDLGTLALRSAVDLTNVLKCVLGFDDAISHAAMGYSAKLVVKHGQSRCLGGRASVQVFSLTNGGNHVLPAAPQHLKESCFPADLLPPAREVGEGPVEHKVTNAEEEVHDDGFITLL